MTGGNATRRGDKGTEEASSGTKGTTKGAGFLGKQRLSPEMKVGWVLLHCRSLLGSLVSSFTVLMSRSARRNFL